MPITLISLRDACAVWASGVRLVVNSFTTENPWLDEAAELDPYSYTVAVNATTGDGMGLADGDMVWIESEGGRRVKDRLKLTQAVHPEGVGIAGCNGHWGGGMPVAKDKGGLLQRATRPGLGPRESGEPQPRPLRPGAANPGGGAVMRRGI